MSVVNGLKKSLLETCGKFDYSLPDPAAVSLKDFAGRVEKYGMCVKYYTSMPDIFTKQFLQFGMLLTQNKIEFSAYRSMSEQDKKKLQGEIITPRLLDEDGPTRVDFVRRELESMRNKLKGFAPYRCSRYSTGCIADAEWQKVSAVADKNEALIKEYDARQDEDRRAGASELQKLNNWIGEVNAIYAAKQ